MPSVSQQPAPLSTAERNAGKTAVPERTPPSEPFRGEPVLWLVGVLAAFVVTTRLPSYGFWLTVKPLAVMGVAGLLAAYLVGFGYWPGEGRRQALRAAPNLAALAFLLWIGISAARSDLPQHSRYEAMRYASGGLLYFSVVYGLSVRRHLARLAAILIGAGALSTVVAFIIWSTGTQMVLTDEYMDSSFQIAGAFNNQQLFAAFLCLLLPVALAVSWKAGEAWLGVVGQFGAITVGVGILMAQNRSVWIASLVSVFALVVLHLRYSSLEAGSRQARLGILAGVVVGVLALGAFLKVSGTADWVAARARSLSSARRREDLKERYGMWNKALRMARDRPVVGWGVGTFPVRQARYYHRDVPMGPETEVLHRGGSLSDSAHNSYLQVLAEMGYPGLVLYLLVPLAFFGTALGAAPRLRPGFRQSVLLGSMAAVVGQMVSALSNPAWEYVECSMFLWLVLGLGMLAAGVGDRGRRPAPGEAAHAA